MASRRSGDGQNVSQNTDTARVLLSPTTVSGELTCSICFEIFESPRALPLCLHTFCEECLYKVFIRISRDYEPLYQCPVCRKVVTPPLDGRVTRNWIKEFPVNHIINTLLASLKKTQDTCTSQEEKAVSSEHCSSCDALKTTDFCFDCHEFMCKQCSDLHNRFKVTKQHQTVSVSGMENLEKHVIELSKCMICPSHKDKTVEFYCPTDDKVFCFLCAAVDHRACEKIIAIDDHISETKFSDLAKMKVKEFKDMKSKVQAHDLLLIKNKDAIKTNLRRVIQSVSDKTNEAIIKLHDFEKKAIEACNLLEKRITGSINDTMQQCRQLEPNIEESWTKMDVASKFGSEKQIFVTMNKLKTEVEHQEKTVCEDHTVAKVYRLIFHHSKTLMQFLQENELGRPLMHTKKVELKPNSTEGTDDKEEKPEPLSRQTELLSNFNSELEKAVKSAAQLALQSTLSSETVNVAEKSVRGAVKTDCAVSSTSGDRITDEKNGGLASSIVPLNVSSSASDGIAMRTDTIPLNSFTTGFNSNTTVSCLTSTGSNTLQSSSTNLIKSKKDTHSAAVASFITAGANGATTASSSLSSVLNNKIEANAQSLTAASAAVATRDQFLPGKKTDVVSSRSATPSGSPNMGGINTLAAAKMDTNTVVALTVGISPSVAPRPSNTKLHSLCTVSKPLALPSAAQLVSSSSFATFSNANTATELYGASPVKKPNQVYTGQKEPGFNFGYSANPKVPQEFDFNFSSEMTDKKPQTCFTGVCISQPVKQFISSPHDYTSSSAAKTDSPNIRSVSSADLPFTVPAPKSSAYYVSASFNPQYGHSAFVPVVPSSSLIKVEKHAANSSVPQSVLPSYSQVKILSSHSVTKSYAFQFKPQRSISSVQLCEKIKSLSRTSPADFAKPKDNAYQFSAPEPFTCPASFQFGKSAIPAVMAFGQSQSVTTTLDGPLFQQGTSAPGGINTHQSSAALGISVLQPTSAGLDGPQVQPTTSAPQASKFHSSTAVTEESQLQQTTAATTGSQSQTTFVAFGESHLRSANGGSRELLHHPKSASPRQYISNPVAPDVGETVLHSTTAASEWPPSHIETAEVEDSLWQLALASGGGSQLEASSTALEGHKFDESAVAAGLSLSQTSIPAANEVTPGKLFTQQTKAMSEFSKSVSPLRPSTFVSTSSSTSGISGTGSAVVLFSEQKSRKAVTKSSRSSYGQKHLSVKKRTKLKTNSPNSIDSRHSKQVSVAKKIRPRLVAQSAKGSSGSVTFTSSSDLLEKTAGPPVVKPVVPGSSFLRPETSSSVGPDTVNRDEDAQRFNHTVPDDFSFFVWAKESTPTLN